jgi:hypothetical protein
MLNYAKNLRPLTNLFFPRCCVHIETKRKFEIGFKMILMRPFLALFLTILAPCLNAQSFEEVVAAAEAQTGDIGRYQQALQNPDVRMQYSLIQQMLKLPDPALQRIAKEHALFSSNAVLREAAIKAVLDSGTTLRMQFTADRTNVPFIVEWVGVNGGVFLEQQGQILVRVPSALSDDCWGTEVRQVRTCVFRQVGNSIQFKPNFPNRKSLSAVLNLGNDGVLRGNFVYNNTEFAQMQIDLKE